MIKNNKPVGLGESIRLRYNGQQAIEWNSGKYKTFEEASTVARKIIIAELKKEVPDLFVK